MHIVVHTSLADIDARQWNYLVTDNNPFMRHEFLLALETTDCVCEASGWQAQHIVLYESDYCKNLVAALPAYIKSHSYGEYIFDWAWADAYHRNGLNYYPKLTNAVPFTPASGPRALLHPDKDSSALIKALLDAALGIVEEKELSSFHSLFLTKEQSQLMDLCGLSVRHSSQFHWQNNNYTSFDDFLGRMSSKKRKNIKRERRRIIESDIHYEWLSGHQLDKNAIDTMYGFYQSTIYQYGAQSYLNKRFFETIAKQLPEQTLFLFARYKEQVIAGGLYFKSDNCLYGRYWGALNNFHSVHFETCYYQAIEWCIKHGYSRFEAGAQGQHKLSRGLEPQRTYSAHWIAHGEFRAAIDNFLQHEEQQVEHYNHSLQTHSPFKSALGNSRPKPES